MSFPNSNNNSTSGSDANAGSAAKIPLTRQRVLAFRDSSGRERRLQQSANATVSTNATVPLINYNSVIYFAEIQINASPFVVLVDTGSSDLWISCAYVSGVSCSATCSPRASVIRYGSGDVCINGASARVQIGDVAINRYVVGIAQGRNVLPSSPTNLLPSGAQGLLGLAYNSLAVIPTPGGQFIDYVTSFSIFLTDDAFADGSFLLLNAVDDALIARNQLRGYTIPLKEQAHWSIGMTAFQVGNDTAVFPCSQESDGATRGCRSIVDTGTSLLTMPDALFNAFASTYLTPLGCFIPSDTTASGSSEGDSDSSPAASSALYVCPTDVNLPRLSFTFGDYSFYLDGSEYTLPIARTEYAIVELQSWGASTSLGDSWIIGDTFLKKFYSSYATNESVTFYCAPGTCTEGSVPATAQFPTSGSNTGRNGGSSSLNPTNSNSGSDSGLSTTETAAVVVAAVFGLVLVLIGALQTRRWLRARKQREAEMGDPSGGAPYRADPLSPIGQSGV